MAFEQQWREQAHHWIAECVRLAQANPDGELEPVLAAVAVLWPLREPVQQFDLEVIAAVHQQAGGGAKFVLRQVQAWDDGDLLKTARRLRRDLAQNPELLGAVNRLLEQFGAKTEFDRLTAAGQPATTIAAAAQPRVFISYARSDGETEAHNLRRRLESEGIAVWQDRVKMVGGRDWWLQITEALDQVEFFLLVATRGALQSAVVHKEWHYARQQGVCVLPIQVQADLPENLIPRWMRRAHFYDIEQEWPRLIQNLNAPCQTPRVPHMVEELPDGFVPRPQLLHQVSAQLVSANGEPLAATVVLHGLGGYGKTLLARSVCHLEAIRQGFDDGILWMTLGETPGDLTERVVDLIEVLTGERPAFAALDAAETHLAQLLGERNFLMVIDDVWQAGHLAPFLQGGLRCGRIITTRNLSTLPPQAQPIEVGPMTRPEAAALLGRGLPAGPEKPLHDLAERLAYWPLLLNLVNGTLRDRVRNDNQPLADALAYVNRALDKRGLTAFDAVSTGARDQAVSHTLGMSRDLLSPDELARFNELAIFPPYAAIPLETLAVFWGATGGLDPAAVEALCQRLLQLSLLARFDIPRQTIALHSILRHYLSTEHAAQLPALHQKFLDAFAQQLPAWAALSHANGYLWSYLAYHLVGAGRGEELVSTVKDLSYLAHKTFLRSVNAAEADLLAARRAAPTDAVLAQLHLSFSQASHLLAECKSLAEVAGTLHSRLAFVPQLAPLAAAAAEVGLPRPLLTANQPLPDLPAASLLRAFAGHNTAVLGCDIDDAGATVVSIDRAAQVKVWDARTGAERLTLAGHQTLGNCCAISGNGAVIVSTAWDGALNVWDAATGELRHALPAHDAPIYACAVSADGSVILSASKDKTVKIWDGVTGALRFTLSGHERTVTGCSLSADGMLAASCALDGTVKLWHTGSGRLQATLTAFELRDYSPVADLTFTSTVSSLLNCALSADGRTLVSTMPNGTLKVWDVAAGAERCVLRGHTGWVENCAVSADGRLLVSAGNDKTLKGWDGVTGDLLFTLKGHLRAVAACAINADGTIIASASHDRSVRLWDARASQEPTAAEAYTSPAQACASSASLLAFGVAEESVQLVEAATRQPGPLLTGHQRSVLSCDVGRRLVVTGSQDHSLKIWDAATGRQLHSLGGHAWAVSDCALTPDEARVVSASDDSTLKIWDTATGAELRTLAGHTRGVNGCAISPDGAFVVSAAADETLKIWDLSTGAERLTLAGHSGPVNGCAVSPDGALIASASRDGTLKIWRSQTGAEVITLTGHTGFVTGCAFHPGGEFLLSVSRDETIKLWRVGTGQCVASLRVSGGLHNCAWAPDGRLALAAGARGVYFLRVVR